jgi:hypothetical protein
MKIKDQKKKKEIKKNGPVILYVSPSSIGISMRSHIGDSLHPL